MRVLVTGAAGWSGSAVVGALLEAGHAVVAHDLARSWEAERERAGSGDTPPWTVPAPNGSSCECVEGDLLVAASVRSAVHGCDAVVHTAVLHPPSVEAVGGEDEVSRLTFLVQTNGLFNVLDAIKDTPSVQRFVHVSSCWTAHVSCCSNHLSYVFFVRVCKYD
jgi:nucleoside-diphosphate-sugar epimerase